MPCSSCFATTRGALIATACWRRARRSADRSRRHRFAGARGRHAAVDIPRSTRDRSGPHRSVRRSVHPRGEGSDHLRAAADHLHRASPRLGQLACCSRAITRSQPGFGDRPHQRRPNRYAAGKRILATVRDDRTIGPEQRHLRPRRATLIERSPQRRTFIRTLGGSSADHHQLLVPHEPTSSNSGRRTSACWLACRRQCRRRQPPSLTVASIAAHRQNTRTPPCGAAGRPTGLACGRPHLGVEQVLDADEDAWRGGWQSRGWRRCQRRRVVQHQRVAIVLELRPTKRVWTVAVT